MLSEAEKFYKAFSKASEKKRYNLKVKMLSECFESKSGFGKIEFTFDDFSKGVFSYPENNEKSSFVVTGKPLMLFKAKRLAIEWQKMDSRGAFSWGRVVQYRKLFERIALKYGLTEDFIENSII